MKRVLLRQASASDVPSIRRLQQQWFEEGSVHGYTPDDQEAVQAALGPYFFVAEVEDAVIGFVSGSIHLSEGTAVIPAGADYIEIDNLYVLPPGRNQGVGSRLVNRLLEEARQQGVSYSLLYSAAKDIHKIIRFYEQHGFESWYVQMFQKL